METIDPQQLDRLPKWARDLIARTTRRVGELEQVLTELRTGTTVSGVTLVDYVRQHEGFPPFYLPQDARVSWAFRDARNNPMPIDVSYDSTHQVIDVRTGAGALRIQPCSSNSMKVWVEEPK